MNDLATDFAANTSVKPEVEAFFDEATNTISYVVKDPASNACAVIDSVMDIDYAAGRISYDHADQIIKYIEDNGLKLEWLIETHVHADHLSAAPYIQDKLGGKIGIGEHITTVQETFGKIFNEGTEFQRDGSQFDALFKDGDTYTIGSMKVVALHTPGHTPACMTHVVGDAGFVGDTLFMPDGGSARADFPGGDAGDLVRFDPEGAGAARRDPAVHVPRLRAQRARHPVGNHGGGRKGPQYPRRRRQDQGRFRQVPHRTGRAACDAAVDYPLPASQHAGWRHATGRRRGRRLLQGAGQQALINRYQEGAWKHIPTGRPSTTR